MKLIVFKKTVQTSMVLMSLIFSLSLLLFLTSCDKSQDKNLELTEKITDTKLVDTQLSETAKENLNSNQETVVTTKSERESNASEVYTREYANEHFIALTDNSLFIVLDEQLWEYDFATNKYKLVMSLKEKLNAEVKQASLFFDEGQLWLLVATENEEQVKTSLLKVDTKQNSAEKVLDLEAWPDTALLGNNSFFFSFFDKTNYQQSIFQKLDLNTKNTELINPNSIFRIIHRGNSLYYVTYVMKDVSASHALALDNEPLFHMYDIDDEQESTLAVSAYYPFYTMVKDKYVTVKETSDPKLNFTVMLSDDTGKIIEEYNFNSGVYPDVLSNGKELCLQAVNKHGDKLTIHDASLAVLYEHSLEAEKTWKLLAMDQDKIYLAEIDPLYLPNQNKSLAKIYSLDYKSDQTELQLLLP